MPSDTSSRRTTIVTGATGLVGHFLVPRLVEGGWQIDALSRRPVPPGLPPDVRWHVHDIAAVPSLPVERADVLFHAAPLWLAPPLVPALAARGLRRVVAFGSTSRFTKQDAASDASRAVARALADAEDRLAEPCAAHGVAWTVFRPTLVHGAGLDRNLSSMARTIRRFGLFPLAGHARGLRQPVHADDLARACLQAVDEPRTFGRAYDLPGGTTLTYRAMVEQLFVALGRRPRILTLPAPLLHAVLAAASSLPRLRHLSPDMADRMGSDQSFDGSEAARDFGYAPRPFDAKAVVAGLEEADRARASRNGTTSG
jgi:nucleoside-diphosphate-sugar epimerase